MAELLRFVQKFKMAAAAILNLLPVTIFTIWSPLGYEWGCLCKILCKLVEKWLSYGRVTDFKMAAAAILNFL